MVVDASFRIVGGFMTNITQVPYQVSLINVAGRSFCGGSIINRTAILTAAHCLDHITSANELIVGVGSNDCCEGGTQFNVSRYLMHPKYDASEHTYDIAILILDGIITYSNSIRAIRLPEASDNDIVGNTVGVVSGWGVYNVPTRQASQKLKAAYMRVLPQKECENIIEHHAPERETVAKSYFCVGGQNYKHGACWVKLMMYYYLILSFQLHYSF